MFRAFTLFILICLFSWLMPLGAFIKPSQEKVACDGCRAFHMCSMMTGKVRTDASSKVSFANGTGVERTAKSSAAGGDDFLPVETLSKPPHKSQKNEPVFFILTGRLFFPSLDRPPQDTFFSKI